MLTLWNSFVGWAGAVVAYLRPQTANFEALQAQYQAWADAQSRQYLAMSAAQEKRIQSVESLADRYREWATRHIEALERDLSLAQQQKDAAVVRIVALEAEKMASLSRIAALENEVAGLKAEVQSLRQKLNGGG